MMEANKSVKTQRAGLLTKIVICILLIYLGMTLLSLHDRIQETKTQVDTLEQQIQDQKQKNTELANAIENHTDPSHIRDIAREKLDLVEPNEWVFEITD